MQRFWKGVQKIAKRIREPWQGRIVTYGQLNRGVALRWACDDVIDQERKEQAACDVTDSQLLDSLRKRTSIDIDVDLRQFRTGFKLAFDAITNSFNNKGSLHCFPCS